MTSDLFTPAQGSPADSSIQLPSRRPTALLLGTVAASSLAFGGAMDWGMAGLFWVLSGALLLISRHLWHRETLFFLDDELYKQRGRNVQKISWLGELCILPMGTFSALLIVHQDGKEFPLATWRRQKVALRLANDLNSNAPVPLPIKTMNAEELEWQALRRGEATNNTDCD